MPDYDDVDRIARRLPEVTTGLKWNTLHWLVDGRGFVWVRPFSKADLKRFGDDPVPPGPILGVATADLARKEALLASGQPGVFTIPHFDGYAAVLVDLSVVNDELLAGLIADAWSAKAPKRLLRGA